MDELSGSANTKTKPAAFLSARFLRPLLRLEQIKNTICVSSRGSAVFSYANAQTLPEEKLRGQPPRLPAGQR